jgi:predicted dehydrogenase
MAARARVGLIGCGNISRAYLSAGYEQVEYVACADLVEERAQAAARAHGLKVLSPEELLADPSIDVVCNLTLPQAHAQVSLAAIAGSKHVYQEKPLALGLREARELLEEADRRHLRLGCAPDTFFGAGLQTCRRAIDSGIIGVPKSAVAHMVISGHESWHPDPAFYYLKGGGPLFDMGPYYLSALVNLVGPIVSVSALCPGSESSRIVRSGPKQGDHLVVEVPTHVAGLLKFATGAVGSVVFSFDVWGSELPKLEIHGTEGSLSLPDPNDFVGPVRLFRPLGQGWEDIATTSFTRHRRGVGLADLIDAVAEDRPHRASASLAYHVLDVMLALMESAECEQAVRVRSSVQRPDAMPGVTTTGAPARPSNGGSACA